MKKTIQRISAIFLSICCMLCFSNVDLMAVDNNSDQFTIILNCEETVDMTGVEISVYKKVNVKQYTDNLSSYDKEYVCSAMSDKNGIIHFDRPAGDYIVEFDLSTLPSGTGITKQIIDYTQSVTNDTVTLYPITSIEAILTQGNINFKFKNSNNAVLTNYEILSHTIENVSNMESTINTGEYIGMNLTLSHMGQIDVNGTVYPYSVNEEFTELTLTEYLSILHINDIISEEEYAELLCKTMGDNFENKIIDEDVLAELWTLQDKISNVTIQRKIDSAISTLAYVENPATLDYVSRTFYCTQGLDCCEGGVHNIRVYYSSPCTRTTANNIADKVIGVFTYFVNQLDFLCPQSIDYTNEITGIDNSFCVLLSPALGTSAVSWGNRDDGSLAAYIVLDYRNVNLCDTHIAHEFQHCIQNRHKLDNSADLWWKEACANWAAMLYADDVLGDLSDRLALEFKAGIQYYLASPEISITASKDENNSTLRVYSPLLPIMLSQAYNDADTIVDIYYEITLLRTGTSSRTNQQIFTAIGNVIEDLGNHDLRYELEHFGRSNYQYASNYNWYRGTAWTDTRIINTSLTQSVLHNTDIDHVGYGYFELSSSPTNVTINIDVTSTTPTEFTCWVIEGFNTNGTAKSTKIRFTSSELNINYDFSSALGNNLVLIVENTSTQNNSDVYITVN